MIPALNTRRGGRGGGGEGGGTSQMTYISPQEHYPEFAVLVREDYTYMYEIGMGMLQWVNGLLSVCSTECVVTCFSMYTQLAYVYITRTGSYLNLFNMYEYASCSYSTICTCLYIYIETYLLCCI